MHPVVAHLIQRSARSPLSAEDQLTGDSRHVRTWRLPPRTPKPGKFPAKQTSLEHATRPPASRRAVPAPPGGEVAQENSVRGDVEVWEANAGTLSTVSVTATAAVSGFPIAQTEVAYKNATGIGARGTFSSASGAPTGTITTTQAKSHVWAVGFDPRTATSRTVGAGQRLANQVKAHSTTSWVQTTTTPTLAAGTSVTINDTAPTTDPYDLILVEIL